jgi:hypothetical protein
MIFLGRQQLVDFNIDTVPSSNPLGQDSQEISIPGVIGDGQSAVVLEGLASPDTMPDFGCTDFNGAIDGSAIASVLV